MTTLLQIKDLRTFFFTPEGVVRAVDGISYDVKQGETVGIVGESGCGKSVSALTMMRLIPQPPGKVLSGQVLFDGVDLLKVDEEEIRRVRGHQIAMVFQEPMTSLNPVLTLGDQLSEAMVLHLNMDKKAALKRSIELLDLVGISDAGRRVHNYPHQFSGGMRQRVMIAMALSCNPKLLIADEPTTAVDVTIQAQLLELIARLGKEFKTAVMIITHNLGVVARYANWVNVMYAGRIIESASSRDVYGDPHHPYTVGLLLSVPRLDEPRKVKLLPIEGAPPDLVAPPPGCYFHPRCRFRIDVCFKEYPPLELVADNHWAACWVAKEMPWKTAS